MECGQPAASWDIFDRLLGSVVPDNRDSVDDFDRPEAEVDSSWTLAICPDVLQLTHPPSPARLQHDPSPKTMAVGWWPP